MLLLPGLARLTQDSLNLYTSKNLALGTGPDTILAFDANLRPRDGDIAAAVRWLATNVPPRATLAVLPQGALVNYLSRHVNPSGYVVWAPPEMAAFGQEKMTRALISHGPDYLMECYVDFGEYGESVFGREKRFGLEAQQWIDTHYHAVFLIGHDWMKDGQFGIKILQRNRYEP
jgi:hypothetical protein